MTVLSAMDILSKHPGRVLANSRAEVRRAKPAVPHASPGLALLVVLCALGCRTNTPQPLPDVARTSGVKLSANPTSLVIRPGSSGRIRFTARDSNNQPLAGYPIDFAISGSSTDTATAGLSIEHSLADTHGESVVEVMVGALASKDRPVAFSVVATYPGASAAQADILVTTNAYSVEILPVPADDLLGAATVTATRLYFYDNAACANLDIYNVGASLPRARGPQLVAANSSAVFPGVAASGVHAVIGLGLDSSQTTRIGGCVDVPGSALLESEIIRATLLLDHLFPAASGSYLVSSDFQLVPAPTALTGIRVAWQQWARCPLDPARLWVDCTIAALGSAADAARCIPVAGTVGPTGDLLLASRGTIVPAIGGTLTNSADTPCRGPTDGAGHPSLDAWVDALFSGVRDQLSSAKLGALPAELAGLLDDLRLASRMVIAPASDPNGYWLEHQLIGVAFPDGPKLVAFEIPALGLPATTAAGIHATLKADQLSIPSHGFTLRLGTVARYAFEEASLRPRNASDSAVLVEAIFGLASSGGGQQVTLTGCAAFDAVACDQIGQNRGCVIDACRSGLAALSSRLAAVFEDLDGTGLDFHLAGSAPVIDLEGDGRADALGSTGSTGGSVAGPGLWSAQLDGSGGAYAAYGAWVAARETATR